MATTYEPISTVTLGSAASSITFSSIPNTYTDLRLVLTTAATTGGTTAVYLNFNNDTGTNYSDTNLRANGSTVASGRDTNAGYIFLTGNALSTTLSLFNADIFSYAGSTYKTVLSTANQDANGSGFMNAYVSLWRSTSAINRLDITVAGTTMIAGTTATLYGIKAA